MSEPSLTELALRAARTLAETTGLPVAVADADGRLLARAGEGRFCPLLAREEGSLGAPLPERCRACPRIDVLIEALGRPLPPCPHESDSVRRIEVDGEPAGFVVTALVPRELGPDAAERASGPLRLADLLLGAAIAADRRERFVRDLLAQKLLVARNRAARAVERLRAGGPADAREMDLARDAIEQACDALAALRPPPGRELAD